jgi:hypothetical protein
MAKKYTFKMKKLLSIITIVLFTNNAINAQKVLKDLMEVVNNTMHTEMKGGGFSVHREFGTADYRLSQSTLKSGKKYRVVANCTCNKSSIYYQMTADNTAWSSVRYIETKHKHLWDKILVNQTEKIYSYISDEFSYNSTDMKNHWFRFSYLDERGYKDFLQYAGFCNVFLYSK